MVDRLGLEEIESFLDSFIESQQDRDFNFIGLEPICFKLTMFNLKTFNLLDVASRIYFVDLYMACNGYSLFAQRQENIGYSPQYFIMADSDIK